MLVPVKPVTFARAFLLLTSLLRVAVSLCRRQSESEALYE